jgi:hypothetical protein
MAELPWRAISIALSPRGGALVDLAITAPTAWLAHDPRVHHAVEHHVMDKPVRRTFAARSTRGAFCPTTR